LTLYFFFLHTGFIQKYILYSFFFISHFSQFEKKITQKKKIFKKTD